MAAVTLGEAAAGLGGLALRSRVVDRTGTTADAAAADLAARLDAALLEAAQTVLLPALKVTLATMGPPASEPGMPPHTRPPEEHAAATVGSGLRPLAESLFARAAPEGGAAVGTHNLYGVYLEMGTREMAPRPWVAWTLQRPDVLTALQAAVAAALARQGGAGPTGPGGPAPGAPGTA